MQNHHHESAFLSKQSAEGFLPVLYDIFRVPNFDAFSLFDNRRQKSSGVLHKASAFVYCFVATLASYAMIHYRKGPYKMAAVSVPKFQLI